VRVLLAEMRHAVYQVGSYRATIEEHDLWVSPGVQPPPGPGAVRGWALVDLRHARRREHLTQWIYEDSHGKGRLSPAPVDWQERGAYAAYYFPDQHRWLCVLPHYGEQYRTMDAYTIPWLLSLPKQVTREVVLGQVRLGPYLTWHVQVKEVEQLDYGIVEHDTIDGYIGVRTRLPVSQIVRGLQTLGPGRYRFRFHTHFGGWGVRFQVSLPRSCHG
jgi:hypothetical protein